MYWDGADSASDVTSSPQPPPLVDGEAEAEAAAAKCAPRYRKVGWAPGDTPGSSDSQPVVGDTPSSWSPGDGGDASQSQGNSTGHASRGHRGQPTDDSGQDSPPEPAAADADGVVMAALAPAPPAPAPQSGRHASSKPSTSNPPPCPCAEPIPRAMPVAQPVAAAQVASPMGQAVMYVGACSQMVPMHCSLPQPLQAIPVASRAATQHTHHHQLQTALPVPQAIPQEERAPAAAEPRKPPQSRRFRGKVRSFVPETGFGFISCRETLSIYKQDVFLHRAQFVGVCCVGQTVEFSVELNKDGKPQAREVHPMGSPRHRQGYGSRRRRTAKP
eukprot:TRINITY_DN12211_c0_g3_i2.p1 TRINITY_DN12211_c0_g3~~TRINITY_DN12211_c0_g3_i2.p1  ORF type:complete len:330 (+),score=34.93 TRINITY_DN12211_c0_g3_i2:356-1345(+)